MIPKPKVKPFVAANAAATSAVEDTTIGQIQNYNNLAADQQELVKNYMKKPDAKPQQGIDTAAKIASAISLIDGFIPGDPIDRFHPVQPQETYNPYAYGTGSQAIMKHGGKMQYKKMPDGGVVNPMLPQNGTASTGKFADNSQDYSHLSDLVNYNLAQGGNPLQNDYGRAFVKSATTIMGQKQAQDVMDSIILFNNNPVNRNLSGDQRIRNYYSQQHTNPNVQNYAKQVNQIGYSPVSSYWDSPDIAPKQQIAPATARMPDGGILAAMSGGGGASALMGADPMTGMMMEGIKKFAAVPQEFMGLFSKINALKDMDNGGTVSKTMHFNGPSHEDGGIPISYGGKQVEVEGGETGFTDQNNNLHIMGNMRVPGTKKKFKSISKAIAQKEEHYANIGDKGAEAVNKADMNDKFDRLKFNAGEIMMKGAEIGRADLDKKKLNLASIQNALLATAEEYNLDPEALSEGKTKKAKAGTFAKAASGATVGGGEDPNKPATLQEIIAAIGGVESGNDYFIANPKKGQTAFGKYQMIEALRKDIWAKNFKDEYATFKEFDEAFKTIPRLQDEAMGFRARELSKKYNGDLTKIVLAHRLGEGGVQQYLKNPAMLDVPISSSNPKSPDKETPRQYLTKVGIKVPQTVTPQKVTTGKPAPTPVTPTVTPPNIPLTEVPFTYTPPVQETPETYTPPNYGTLKPPVEKDIPSNVRQLDPLQILPELFAFGQNKEEPVPMQQYSPDLFDPYQVSFQDRRNENQSTFNALTRQVNSPTALATLAAQKYNADSNVGAEEFRTNQGIANQIINQNTGLLNDTQLKNLTLADTQMVRQSTARSNTKAQNSVIANSIAGKYLDNRLENQRLAVYENMYDYRFVDTNKDGIDDRATYMGPDAVFNTDPLTGAATKNTPYARTTQRLDAANQVKETRITIPSQKEQEAIDLELLKKKNQVPAISIPRLFNVGTKR